MEEDYMKSTQNECVAVDEMITLPPEAEWIKNALANGGGEYQKLRKEYNEYVDKQITDLEEDVRRKRAIVKECDDRIRQNETDKTEMLRLKFNTAKEFAEKAETEADREKWFNKMNDISNQFVTSKDADTEKAEKEKGKAEAEAERKEEKKETLVEARKQDNEKDRQTVIVTTTVAVGVAALATVIRKWGPSIVKALAKTTK